jgi:DNA-binding transcriptional LysR family regulator
MNWDDFRYVLALGRARTLAAAAESLGVHYTSVARRIQQTEASLGTRLFEHGRREHTLTPAGEELLQIAERIENEVFVLDRALLGKDARLSGTLRVAMTQWLAIHLAKDFAEFSEEHRDIDLQITIATDLHNLSRREADVALRFSNSPPEHLVGRRVATMWLAPYATKELVERMGDRPLSEWPWVEMDPKTGPTLGKEWLDVHAAGRRPPFTLDDYQLAGHLMLEGVVANFAPNGSEQLYPNVVRIGDWLPFKMGVWVLTHPALRNTARIRAFMQFIAPRMKALYPDVENRVA